MSLSNELISQFVKTATVTEKKKLESTVYGTTVEYNGSIYVKLDGSEQLTPITTTVGLKAGERVSVLIKNHSAIVTGNVSTPSARKDTVDEMGSKISEFEIVIADKVSTKDFDAQTGRIDNLVSDNVKIKDSLTASNAKIESLEADNVQINEKLTANSAAIENLDATKISAEVADFKYATIEGLEATDAKIVNLESTYGDFKKLTTEKFEASDGRISDIEAENVKINQSLEATDAKFKSLDTQYANIDFSNIGTAAMEHFYAHSGLIKDVTVGDQTITGKLVGVTISGDLIEGNTIVAEKLVIKGDDGLYYKLNTDGVTKEAEQTDYNSLNGSVIKAKSVTAEKISVKDLVAFDATIGGFNITESSIYSGAKASIDNTTRGLYMDKTGQFAIGDSKNFLKFFKDTDGLYKLEISANSLVFSGTDSSLEDVISDIQTDMDNLRDEIATFIQITSSKGVVFKNTSVSTILSVTVCHGNDRITNITQLKETFGESAHIQWKSQREEDDDFLIIPPEDERVTEDGFKFTISPTDLDTKGIYTCDLEV